MKQAVLKKLLVSGVAALGVIGLSAPAAFAMGNGYNSSYGNGYSRCYGAQGWNNNNWNNGCQPVYVQPQPYRYVSYNYSKPMCNRYGGDY